MGFDGVSTHTTRVDGRSARLAELSQLVGVQLLPTSQPLRTQRTMLRHPSSYKLLNLLRSPPLRRDSG